MGVGMLVRSGNVAGFNAPPAKFEDSKPKSRSLTPEDGFGMTLFPGDDANSRGDAGASCGRRRLTLRRRGLRGPARGSRARPDTDDPEHFWVERTAGR